jgi:hypothetical protein
MVGPIRTDISPEVAPLGIVIVMDVSLQELIIVGWSFRTTKLVPCAAPKLEPETTTWLPIGPVVADSEVITGAGTEEESIETLSNGAVARELEPPSTARPM